MKNEEKLIKLNIYEENGVDVEKVVELDVNNVVIMSGTIKKAMKAINIDDLIDKNEDGSFDINSLDIGGVIQRVIMLYFDIIEPELIRNVKGLTSEDIDNTRMEELVEFLILFTQSIIARYSRYFIK